jgi:hypothetical protein
MTTLLDTFWLHTRKSGECLLWTRGKNTAGYGVVWNRRRAILAHRHAYELTAGPVPPGMYVLHSCDNPACVRPEHLRIGTSADNARDRSARKRYRDDRGSRHPSAKLNEAQVLRIRQRLTDGVHEQALASEFNVTRQMIRRIGRRIAWTHV